MSKIKKRSELSILFMSFLDGLPWFVSFEKIIQEFNEHKEFVQWIFFRILIPIIVFHVLLNLFIFERFLLAPTIFGILVFFYSAFFIDLDSFFDEKKGSKKASILERGISLFFTPLVIYYLLSEKIKLFHLPKKYFHRKKSMYFYIIFLFILGYAIFFTWWDAIFFAFFGLCGYLTHLFTDKVLFNENK